MLDYTNIIKEQGTLETIYKQAKAEAKLQKGRNARARQLECLRLKNEKEKPKII
tara:strand:- start:57 stop:218 length:162 start_codon:yes stop_codon:yes gene_type:complete